MESVLPLIALLACPLGMAGIGAAGWLWAKARGRADKTEASSANSVRTAAATEGA